MLIAANVVVTVIACGVLLAIARTSLPQGTLRVDLVMVAPAVGAASMAAWLGIDGWRGGSFDVLLAALAISAWTDIKTGLILDRVLLPSGTAILLLALASNSQLVAVVGATGCGVAILVLWFLSKGRGIGLGDAKLAALLGSVFGLIGGMLAVGAAFITGACYVGVLALAGRLPANRSIVFGPFLGLGGVAAIVWHMAGAR